MSIRTRATLMTAVFVFMSALMLSVLSYRMQRHSLLAEATRKAELALTMLTEMASTPLSNGDLLELAITADRAARGEARRVYIAYRDGTIVADSEHKAYDETNPLVQQVLRTKTTVIRRHRDYWEAAAPVTDGSQRLVGAVAVTFSTDYIDKDLRETASTAASFALLALLAGGVLAYFFGDYISRSFTPLIRSIRQVTTGDFESRVAPVGVAELDEIGRAFNSMSALVGNRVRELETLNDAAARLSAAASVEEFAEELHSLSDGLGFSNCLLALGDPRTGYVHVPGLDPAVRRVPRTALALEAAGIRSPVTVGTRGRAKPGSSFADGIYTASAVVAPLVTPDDEIIGVLMTENDPAAVESPGRESVATTEALAIMVAPMIASVRRRETQEAAVEALREILLPESPLQPEGLEVAAAYEAAESSGFGGDYYDVLQLQGGAWGFVIGDFSGKGLSAGRYTAMAKYAVRSFAIEYSSVCEIVSHTNTVLAAQLAEPNFLTLFLAGIEPDRRKLTFCNAGHLPALHYSRSVGEITELSSGGIVVGLIRDIEYVEQGLPVDDGDVVLMYTDGIVEALRDGEMYGFARLHKCLKNIADRPAREIAPAVVEDVREFTGGGLRDDAAVMVIKIK